MCNGLVAWVEIKGQSCLICSLAVPVLCDRMVASCFNLPCFTLSILEVIKIIGTSARSYHMGFK